MQSQGVPSLTGTVLPSSVPLQNPNRLTSLDIQRAKFLRTSPVPRPVCCIRCPLRHIYTLLLGTSPTRRYLSRIPPPLDPKTPHSQHIQTWPTALPAMTTTLAGSFTHLLADTMRSLSPPPPNTPLRGAWSINSSLDPSSTRSSIRTTQGRNSVTGSVVDASTARPRRRRRGAALCSTRGS